MRGRDFRAEAEGLDGYDSNQCRQSSKSVLRMQIAWLVDAEDVHDF